MRTTITPSHEGFIFFPIHLSHKDFIFGGTNALDFCKVREMHWSLEMFWTIVLEFKNVK
uniref:Uncharacterized protein n=1 Tax=Oryza brachyantha TaxID=4533 RepID=J3MIP8_ORYBR